MIPLEHEKSSLGKPQMFHCLMATGSPNALVKTNFSEVGISAFVHAAIQRPTASFLQGLHRR
jgi:hypothetical protein